ncbi:MAG TPA: ATP-binding protein [Gemmatimonadales bacterium]
MTTDSAAVREARVLLLPPTRRDADAIRKLLEGAAIPCVVCGSLPELCAEITAGAAAVLISEEAFVAEAQRLVNVIRHQPVWSDLSTIVLSRSGAESPRLTAVLPAIGNATVIERPIRITTFLTLIRSVLRARSRQYEVRDRLREVEIAGEALRREEARYRDLVAAFSNLLDSAPFGVYVVDSQLRMYSVNASSQGAFANVHPLIGRDFGEVMRILWPEAFAAEAVARFRHTLETGEPYIAPTLTEVRADVGDIESYEWELHRVQLPGEFGVVCYFYDSTKLRHVEFELREARRKVEAATLAGEVGIYYWDVASDRLSGDANFRSFFDVEVDALGAAPIDAFMELIHPDDREMVREAVEATLAHDAPYQSEYRIRHPNGERWIVARGVVERNSEGAPIGWAGVIVDITERKRAEEERRELLESERAARADAERAGRIKDEFLATLSHELRTPLSAIMGWSEVLKLPGRSPADLEQGLATIERNARAQTRIIEDLLDMSRIVSGKVRLDVQPIDLELVVAAAVDTVRPAADAKGVVIDVDPAMSGVAISGDPSRLQQVFWNLLSNAVKFTPRGGRIDLRIRQQASQVDVTVADTGEGIDPAFLPLLFDRFRQADATTTRHHGGLGLGLAIVKQLVELHGGTVTAESAGVQQGASLTVSLPTVAMQPDVASDAVMPVPMPVEMTSGIGSHDIAGIRILVVDDEPDSRALVKRLLETGNATVVAAGSAAEALQLFSVFRPAVVISDIGMPIEDGYSLIRRLRALSPGDGGNTPAIALTAYARNEDRDRALLSGFQDHVVKPIEPARLLAAIARVAGPGAGLPS